VDRSRSRSLILPVVVGLVCLIASDSSADQSENRKGTTPHNGNQQGNYQQAE
jgi:hypothetical protein